MNANENKVWNDMHRMWEQGKLTTKNIDAKDSLPCYLTVRRYFGKLKNIKDAMQKGKSIDDVFRDDTTPEICRYCAYNFAECEKEAKKCESEADLYYSLGDTNNVTEFCKG